MSIHISSVVPGKDILAKDLFTQNGVLLARAGTVITREFKDGMKKFGIIEVPIAM